MPMLRSGRVLLASGLLMSAVTMFSACSSGGSSQAVPSDPVLARGQQIYTQNCASCHGQAGGGGLGPKLAGLVAKKYPNIADQEAVIANGRSSMPKFSGRLDAAEINAVARYEREFLGAG
jgi:cytochrome c oxidase subunit 2